MTNFVQTPVEEIELTDVQLEAVSGAWGEDNYSTSVSEGYSSNEPGGGAHPSPGSFAPPSSGDDAHPSPESFAPSTAAITTPHVFSFKKQSEFIFLKKDEKTKILKLG